MHGLVWYDSKARTYDPVLGIFPQMDPLAEKYHPWSPYVYCMGNPVKNMDPDGRTVLIWYREEGNDKLFRYDGTQNTIPNNQFVNDFTWYLRNLMLLKSADDMEDVLEMSSEHLALLKEEAQMVDTEVLMRYIQVLSALSSDIKYASQKRVLIEIALIKLCKPQMEQDISALNNRMANLEKKVESGIPVVMAPSTQAVQKQSQSSAPVEKEPLPAAIPEEVKEIVPRWGSVVGRVSPMIKSSLKNVSTITVNDRGELVLIFDEPEGCDRVDGDIINRPETINEICKSIEDLIHKTVQIKVEINKERISSQNTKTDVRDYFAGLGIEIEQDE